MSRRHASVQVEGFRAGAKRSSRLPAFSLAILLLSAASASAQGPCGCLSSLAARPRDNQIALTWAPDGGAITVLRSTTDAKSGFASLATASGTATSYVDNGIVQGRTYYYRLRSASGCQSPVISIVSRGRIANRPPAFTSSPPASARAGIAYAYDAQAADPDAQSLIYFLDQGPQGMAIDSVTGLVQWTPGPGDVGASCVALRVSDGTASAGQNFSLSVEPGGSPPRIAADISPAPNPAGWHSQAATVTFTCSEGMGGIASCSSPVTIGTEGRGQQVSGRVQDHAGNRDSLQVRVHIDLTPPRVSISSPAPGSATRDDSLTIRGLASDALSGIAGVTCAGRPGVRVDSQFTCRVPVMDSLNAFQVEARDSAGWTATAQVMVLRDTSGPRVTLMTPSPGGWSNLDSATVAGFSEEPLASLTVNGRPATVEGSAFHLASLPLVSGENLLRLVGTDTLGNAATAVFTVRGDRAPPVVQILSPTSGAALAAQPARIVLVYRDSLSGLDTGSLAIQLNGVDIRSRFLIGSDSAVCAVPESLAFLQGANSLVAFVRDSAGNFGQAYAGFTLDTRSPDLVIESPQHQTTLGDLEVQVRLRYADSGVGIRFGSLQVELDGHDVLPRLSDAQGLVTGRLSLPSGTHVLIARVEDTLGHTAADTAEFTLPVPVPVLAITDPPDLSTVFQPDIVVRGTMSRPMQRVVVQGGVEATLNGNTFQALVPLADARNAVMAVGYDEQGRMASASVTVTLDRSSPTLDLTSPPDSLVTRHDSVVVSGILFDRIASERHRQPSRVRVNGHQALVGNNTFQVKVPLNPGANVLTAVVTDPNNNSQNRSVTVFRDTSSGGSLRVHSGDGQADTVLHTLAAPLVALALDANGAPLVDTGVLFRVEQGSGTFANGKRLALVRTDAQGRAAILFRLGHKAGAGCNRVRAQIVGLGEAWFHLTALPRRANKINTVSGDYQFGLAGAEAPRPLSALVTDSAHNPVAGMPVTFSVVEGGGWFDGGITSLTDTTGDDGRVSVTFNLGSQPGRDNNRVDATFPGNPGLPATFILTGRRGGPPESTKVSGIIHDNTDLPVPGVVVTLEQGTQQAVSDSQGRFTIHGAPVGNLLLKVDGSTATRPGDWTTLEFELVSIAGENNTIGMPIYLTQMATPEGKVPSLDSDVVIGVKEVPGFELTVKKGSAKFPLEREDHTISVTQVHNDKIPMPPGEGMQPNFIVAIMPHDVKFYPPAPVCFPNSDGFEPGRQTNMYSFDHDLGTFVPIGTGTVTEDGAQVCSDKGFGIVKGGWHCAGPNNPVGTVQSFHVEIYEVLGGESLVSATSGPNFYITGDSPPRMPIISAKARIIGLSPDPTPSTIFEWNINTKFKNEDCDPLIPVIRRESTLLDFSRNVSGGHFIYNNNANIVRGGDLKITVSATINGLKCTDIAEGYKIGGINPTHSVVENTSGVFKISKKIACHESIGQRQFRVNSNSNRGTCPLFNLSRHDGGVGIMQLTSSPPAFPDPPYEEDFWNWEHNLRQGQTKLLDKAFHASEYPRRLRRNPAFRQKVEITKAAYNLDEIILNNFASGDFEDNLQQLQLDAIRGFNGWAGTDQFGLELHEFRVAIDANGLLVLTNIDNAASRAEVVWERVPPSDRPSSSVRNYVDIILNTPSPCN